MNEEFLIVVTSVGLVFATLLYLLLTCEIPDPKGSAKPRIWGTIGRVMTQQREATARSLGSTVSGSPGTLIMLESQKRRISSLAPPVNKP